MSSLNVTLYEEHVICVWRRNSIVSNVSRSLFLLLFEKRSVLYVQMLPSIFHLIVSFEILKYLHIGLRSFNHFQLISINMNYV